MVQISKKRVDKNLEKQICNIFFQLIADLKNVREVEEFLKDFLTKVEMEIIVKRLGVAYLLDKNQNYEEIRKKLAVSSATIATIKNQMKRKGFQIGLKKIQAEEWATKWTEKISKIVKLP